ncbi:hypothetical protein CDAR_588591 [Caerostris darwini]|uniref:Uncharacterized protein n=1 Tax=Caerostris darwini TaxID=1538125 RepID=A0AAV4MGU0_9ARAC|nr:hypothetical protein CDAR_588591 [Caerostris darwini]
MNHQHCLELLSSANPQIITEAEKMRCPLRESIFSLSSFVCGVAQTNSAIFSKIVISGRRKTATEKKNRTVMREVPFRRRQSPDG